MIFKNTAMEKHLLPIWFRCHRDTVRHVCRTTHHQDSRKCIPRKQSTSYHPTREDQILKFFQFINILSLHKPLEKKYKAAKILIDHDC